MIELSHGGIIWIVRWNALLTHDEIAKAVAKTAEGRPIKRVSLFVLSAIKNELEDLLNIPVDVVRGPLPEGALVELREMVRVYG